jgi:uncharacterized protein (DUF58 family)
MSPFSGWWAVLRDTFGFTPTRRLAYATAAIAPLWLLAWVPGGIYVPSALVLMLAVALVADVALLPVARNIEIARTFPQTLGIGDEAEGTIRVRSHWNRDLLIQLSDALPKRFIETRTAYDRVALKGRGSSDFSFAAVGAYRGDTTLGDLAIRVTNRLGLAARIFRYPQTDRVLVAPSMTGVKRFRWLAVHHKLASVGIRATRRRGDGRAFSRLRDYVVGDDPRYIDWKATARRGHPITREFTVERSQTVFVLVDAGRTMTQIAGRFPRFEYALSATLLLADVASTAGDLVGGLVFDDAVRALVPAQRGSLALQSLRNALIPVQPTLVEPDYATAFGVLATRQRKRSLVVLITDVVDARVARSLLAHITRSAARHLAVVVALRNETLIQAAGKLGAKPTDIYAAAAAEELLAERLTALQRMRDAGVVVLDVAPDAMSAAVINQYLELKSRGAI